MNFTPFYVAIVSQRPPSIWIQRAPWSMSMLPIEEESGHFLETQSGCCQRIQEALRHSAHDTPIL